MEVICVIDKVTFRTGVISAIIGIFGRQVDADNEGMRCHFVLFVEVILLRAEIDKSQTCKRRGSATIALGQMSTAHSRCPEK